MRPANYRERKAGRHRSRVLPDGRWMCSASLCGVSGSEPEVTAHVRFKLVPNADGSWSGPANLTAASLGEMLGLLGLSNA